VLGLERVVVVGYSMGGMVAQLVWKRHPELVAGVVLCATARNVRGSPAERLISLTLPAFTSTMQWNPAAQALTSGMIGNSVLGHIADPATRSWATRELSRTSLSSALSAVQAVSEFTSHQWIGELHVPAAVVVTTRDRLVPESRQRRLAAAIPHANVVELAGDHGVCVKDPAAFGAAIGMACSLVLPSV
jgi:3-oxoadipate enol-lactonase